MMELRLEWDERKARANFRKHKVALDEACSAFGDPLLLTYADEEHSLEEERFISIGTSAGGRVLSHGPRGQRAYHQFPSRDVPREEIL